MHIHALVMHWQSKQLSQKTIYEKVCFIRKASNIAGGKLPPNKALGITMPDKKDRDFSVSVKSTAFIKNQIIKDICDLQLHFGLKKSEAMQVSYFHDYYDRLFIDRKIAYNHHERYIHYQDKTQRELLINIIKRYQTNQLVPTNARRNISRLHTQVLASQEIYEDEYFRKLYMFNRYQVLNRYCIDKGINFRKIADEVGFRDINQVAKVIKCLENN